MTPVWPGRLTAPDYIDLAQRTAPRGGVWRLVTGERLRKFWAAVAESLALDDGRIHDMIEVEGDPRTATETIAAWEEMCGIVPDSTIAIADRRASVYAHILAVGGGTADYFETLILDAYGITVIITTLAAVTPCMAPCYPLYPTGAAYSWLVTGPAATGATMRASIQALIYLYQPLHTRPYFSWTA